MFYWDNGKENGNNYGLKLTILAHGPLGEGLKSGLFGSIHGKEPNMRLPYHSYPRSRVDSGGRGGIDLGTWHLEFAV